MRTVVFGGGTSLDNFIARADGSTDWLRWDAEAAAMSAEMWPRFDTVVMGRKTYEAACRHGQADGYPGVTTYVFSRTLAEVPAGITVVREDPAAFVGRAKREPGKDICVMGGGLLGHALFEAGLIDIVGLNIHPVLLGSGIPLFHPGTRPIDLRLQESRPLSNGCVYVRYEVQGGQPSS